MKFLTSENSIKPFFTDDYDLLKDHYESVINVNEKNLSNIIELINNINNQLEKEFEIPSQQFSDWAVIVKNLQKNVKDHIIVEQDIREQMYAYVSTLERLVLRGNNYREENSFLSKKLEFVSSCLIDSDIVIDELLVKVSDLKTKDFSPSSQGLVLNPDVVVEDTVLLPFSDPDEVVFEEDEVDDLSSDEEVDDVEDSCESSVSDDSVVDDDEELSSEDVDEDPFDTEVVDDELVDTEVVEEEKPEEPLVSDDKPVVFREETGEEKKAKLDKVIEALKNNSIPITKVEMRKNAKKKKHLRITGVPK